MTVERYLQLRLGSGSPWRMARNMFTRSFTAPSLRSFWRYWNPGYGYYLLSYCYRPLRKVLPHALALMATFLFCGFFLHDALYLVPMVLTGESSLPIPFVTCWFLLIALGIALTDFFGIQFRAVRSSVRVFLHADFLAATFGITVHISSFI